MLIIKKIEIFGIGPIKELILAFNPHFNIICGTNGIGKTTILNCIAQTFSYDILTVRKNNYSEKGSWNTFFNTGKDDMSKTVVVQTKRPIEQTSGNANFVDLARELVYYKTDRSITYSAVPNISKDPIYDRYSNSKQTHEGTSYSDIRKWFLNRFLWSKHENVLSPEQKYNLQMAIDCFKVANANFSFCSIDPENNDILVNTPLGEIVFEQLSSGYISLIILLLGIIKDIEYRFKDPHIKVSDFRGVLIVDEIDVHLHPELQAVAYLKLKEMLPHAQIFTSTHSPHVIQVAEPKEIIPLVVDGKGALSSNPLVNQEYGCQGWTIEEILTDVMGMRDTRTQRYERLTRKFNMALDLGDTEASNMAFSELDKMLHPNNVLRQVLEIQKIG